MHAPTDLEIINGALLHCKTHALMPATQSCLFLVQNLLMLCQHTHAGSCVGMCAVANLKYLVVSFLPSSTGVLPTAFLIIQLPLVTFGISLKVLCRRFTSASLSPSPSTKRATHLSKAANACTHADLVSVHFQGCSKVW